MTHMKGVEAGVDIIDTEISSLALGTSQPATEVMVKAFEGTEYDTGLDINKLIEIAKYFNDYRDKCLKDGLLNPKVMTVNVNTLKYQVSGGMLSNLIKQLTDAGAIDKLTFTLWEQNFFYFYDKKSYFFQCLRLFNKKKTAKKKY